MVYKNIKDIIDARQQSVIATKQFNDEDVIDLITYMEDQNAIVDRLVLTESSLTKKSIDFIVKHYSHKLKELDISDNGLIDDDIEPLTKLPDNSTLRILSLNNNCLSKEGIAALEACNFEYLDIAAQEPIVSSATPITMFTPQHSCVVPSDSRGQSFEGKSIGKRKAEKLLLDSEFSNFLKTADRTEIEVFFEILQEQSSLRGEKRPYHKSATPV